MAFSKGDVVPSDLTILLGAPKGQRNQKFVIADYPRTISNSLFQAFYYLASFT